MRPATMRSAQAGVGRAKFVVKKFALFLSQLNEKISLRRLPFSLLLRIGSWLNAAFRRFDCLLDQNKTGLRRMSAFAVDAIIEVFEPGWWIRNVNAYAACDQCWDQRVKRLLVRPAVVLAECDDMPNSVGWLKRPQATRAKRRK